ncbi:MAG: HAD-IA family hydrolase [Pseudomonadota bacterium]
MSHNLSTVLFDIGGVLIQLDGMPALYSMMPDVTSDQDVHDRWTSSPAVIAYETGKIPAQEFAAQAIKDMDLQTTPEQFMKEFITWPNRTFPGTFELLDALPDSLLVAALSNTNALHWEQITAVGLGGKFEQTYLSHEIGHLKPSEEAFRIALSGIGRAPGEVLFLDDNAANIDTACKLGIQAHQVRSAYEAGIILKQYGVI